MSIGKFSCPWDSGQVGYIFVTKEDLRKEYHKKIVTAKMKEQAEKILQGEVETYDQYLRGDVYGYKLYKIDSSNLAEDEEFDADNDDPEEYGEVLDSYWGFFGDDYIKEEVNSTIKFYEENDAKEALNSLETGWITLPVKESLMMEA
jgi:hypothetical protein